LFPYPPPGEAVGSWQLSPFVVASNKTGVGKMVVKSTLLTVAWQYLANTGRYDLGYSASWPVIK